MGAVAVAQLPPGFTLDAPASAPVPSSAGAAGLPPGFFVDPPPQASSSPDPSQNGYAQMVAQMESGGKVGAVNGNSGAAGTYQFTPSTAAQYGLSPSDLTNPDPKVQQKVRAAFDQFTSDNAGVLGKTLGRAPNPQELYLAHQQGATGAGLLLKTPNAKAIDALLPAYASTKDPLAAATAAIVQNGGSPDMTAGDFAKLQAQRLSKSATAAMPFSAVKGVSAVLPDQQIGQQPFVGKGTFGRQPGATQAPDEVGNSLNKFLVGAAHGGVDVPLNSLSQGLGWTADKINGALSIEPQQNVAGLISGIKPQGEFDKATAKVDQYNQLYNLTNAGNSTAGTVGNVAGGVATTLLTPELGLLKGASLLPRIGRGLLSGGIYGAEQNSSTGNSLAHDVGVNSALGAGVGALSPLVTKPLGWAASKLFGPGAEAGAGAGGGAAGGAAGRIEPSLTGDVIPPSPAMPPGGPVSAPAKIALKPGVSGELSIPAPTPGMSMGQINDLAHQRVANFESLGLTGESGPTRAMATRDPLEWTHEQNTAAQDVGKPLVTRFQNINAGLQRNVNELQAGTGGDAAVRPYGVGQQVIDFIKGKSREMGNAVSNLYNGVRGTVGGTMGMKPNALFGTMSDASDNAAADPIIASVQRRLAKMGIADPKGKWAANPDTTSKTVLSVDQAEELRKFIGGLDANSPATARVKGQLIDALDKDVLDSAGTDSFAQARSAAHARFSEFERDTLHKIEGGSMEPDDVLKRTVLGGKVADLDALKTSLTSGTSEQIAKGAPIWNNIRYQVLNHLHDAAFGSEGSAMFRPAAFNKALKEIGAERLEMLFSPQELDHIARIQQAGSDAFSDVPLSAVNHSHSGTMLANHTRSLMGAAATVLGGVNKVSKVAGAFYPTPWKLLTDPLEAAAAKAAAAKGAGAMLTPNIAGTAAQTAKTAAMQRAMALLNKLPLPQAGAAANQSRQ